MTAPQHELPAIEELSDDSNVPKVAARKNTRKQGGVTNKMPPQDSVDHLGPITVADLSDSSSSHAADFKDLGMTRKKRKRADGLTCQERITSEVHIKALLGRTCKGCKRACLNTFLSGQAFRDLLEFRQRWVDIHKVDQDRIVSCIKFSALFSFQPPETYGSTFVAHFLGVLLSTSARSLTR